MPEFNSIALILGAALSIWDHKEKARYQDRYMELKRNYYEESSKPDLERDDAVLDRLAFELRLLGAGFAAAVGDALAPPKQG